MLLHPLYTHQHVVMPCVEYMMAADKATSLV
jgi:hypothetical protein